MWRVCGVLLVLAIVHSNAQYSWRRDVGDSRGNLWPAGTFQNVYPYNKHHLPGQGRRNDEPVTERDREPLEPNSGWAGGNADIELVSPEIERDVEEEIEEEVRPNIPKMPVQPMVPGSFIGGGLGGFSGGGHNFFASAGFDFPENPFSLFSGIIGRQKWWQGPNVCVERKEIVDEKEEKEEDEESENESGDSEVIKQQFPQGSGIIVFNGDATFESCSETNNMYTCTKRKQSNGKTSAFTVTYKCCHGYRRPNASPLSKGNCEKVDMKPIMEIVENDLGAQEFASLVRETKLEDQVDQENITLFVPSDEAMKEYEKMSQNNQVDYDIRLLPEPSAQRRKRQIDSVPPKTLVLGHMVPKLYDLNELRNEQILESDNENNTIRINIYPKPLTSAEDTDDVSTSILNQRVMTANCAPITRGNLLTTKEGLVHGLDGVLMPATDNIFQLLENHGEFTILAMALRKSGLYEKLMKEMDEESEVATSYTIFAPTDRAFEQLDTATRMKIVNGDPCTLNILKHHILPHTLCSAAIPSSGHTVTTHNLASEAISLKSTDPLDDNEVPRATGQKRIIRIDDEANIQRPDIIARNGVIHIVDSVMLPESARSIEAQLQQQNFTRFQELIDTAGLREFVSSLTNSTVFAVPDSALESEDFKQKLEELLGDKEKAAEFLRYHIVTRQVASCDMKDEEDLPTAREDGRMLKINLYSTLPMFRHTYNRATANCARILRHDLKSCDSTVHEVDRPLFPPNQTIWESLETDPQYNILVKMIRGTEIESMLKDTEESITFLAANNAVFKALNEEDMNQLLEDKEIATEVLKTHILPEVLCCTGIGHNVWPFVESVRSLNRPLNINRDPNTDEIYIGTTTVAKCDNIATNGVIHRVDKIMLPQRPQMRLPFFRQFMFY